MGDKKGSKKKDRFKHLTRSKSNSAKSSTPKPDPPTSIPSNEDVMDLSTPQPDPPTSMPSNEDASGSSISEQNRLAASSSQVEQSAPELPVEDQKAIDEMYADGTEEDPASQHSTAENQSPSKPSPAEESSSKPSPAEDSSSKPSLAEMPSKLSKMFEDPSAIHKIKLGTSQKAAEAILKLRNKIDRYNRGVVPLKTYGEGLECGYWSLAGALADAQDLTCKFRRDEETLKIYDILKSYKTSELLEEYAVKRMEGFTGVSSTSADGVDWSADSNLEISAMVLMLELHEFEHLPPGAIELLIENVRVTSSSIVTEGMNEQIPCTSESTIQIVIRSVNGSMHGGHYEYYGKLFEGFQDEESKDGAPLKSNSFRRFIDPRLNGGIIIPKHSYSPLSIPCSKTQHYEDFNKLNGILAFAASPPSDTDEPKSNAKSNTADVPSKSGTSLPTPRMGLKV